MFQALGNSYEMSDTCSHRTFPVGDIINKRIMNCVSPMKGKGNERENDLSKIFMLVYLLLYRGE